MLEYFYWIYRIFKEEVLDIPSRIIAIVFLVSLLLLPLLSTNPFLLRIFTLAAIFAIFAVSWDLLSGVTGQINFGHGAFFGIAGYASGLINLNLSVPAYISIPIGSLVGVLLGLVVGVPALRLRGFYLALVTLAFPVILTGLVFIFPDLTGGELGIYGLGRISGSNIADYYIVHVIMLASIYIMYKITDVESKMVRSGVILHAIKEDEITARASGINTTQYKMMAFAVSGFFAGIAGGLYSHYLRAVGPSTLEMFFSLQPVLWVIFGGIGTIYGGVAGVYILYPLTEAMSMSEFGAQIRLLTFAVILIASLFFMPEGITVWVRDRIEVICQRCKVPNSRLRQTCRACYAPLYLKSERADSAAGRIEAVESEKSEGEPDGKIYLDKPWLNFYPPGVPHQVDIPLKSANDLFDEAVEKWKNRTALVFYGRKYSYRELQDKVYRFATALHNLGIRKGDRVALLLLNSPEHYIAFYGTIRIGAIVTPISPVYVASEVRHQLVNSGAEHIICQDILYDVVEKTGVKLKNVILTNIGESLPRMKKLMGISILSAVYQKRAVKTVEISGDGFWKLQDLIRNNPPDPPKVEIDPGKDLLTLPYTGGTTGHPKGVMITHSCVIANAMQFKTLFSFLEEGKDCLLGYMPFYHAAGQFNFLLSGIFQGSTIVVLTTPEIDDILHSIMRYKVTIFNGAPAVYEMLKDSKKLLRVNWKRLKIAMSGADALNESTAKEWKERTGVEIHDCFGMTELSPISHMSPRGRSRPGSMGVPIPNTAAAILDPDADSFMPVGQIGELVVSGPNVCAGYWKNEAATRDCEAMIDGVRWWRTGDLGKMDRDGYFYIYDRKRDLIKYKGLRVYAREVEEVLKTHPDIKSVGVIGQKDVKVGELVKAMVVLEADSRGKLSEMEIMEYCKDKLASYKIPKIVEFVGEIPQTDIGKVSRRELREEEA